MCINRFLLGIGQRNVGCEKVVLRYYRLVVQGRDVPVVRTQADDFAFSDFQNPCCQKDFDVNLGNVHFDIQDGRTVVGLVSDHVRFCRIDSVGNAA